MLEGLFETKRREIAEVLTMLEKEMPTSFFDIQVHLLVHLVDEVKLAGVVSSRWMFFVERYMKTLKDFVRQRAQPEASMAEGWLVYESMHYINEYLSMVDSNIPLFWDEKEDEKIDGEVLQGVGKEFSLSEDMRDAINTFILFNHEKTLKWIELFEEEKSRNASQQRKKQRTRNTKCSTHWLCKKLKEAQLQGKRVSKEELDIAMGCDWKVISTYNHIFLI